MVVFDEASQLPTAQALGAVGRAGQCIVAGDDRQLPPPGGVPGLLDGCLAVGLPLLPLDFHYRSSAQSLIALSNHLFYFGTLKSFPSAHDFGRRLPRDAPLRRAQEAAGAAGVHGLVRVRCDGPMESNAGAVADVQAVLCALPWRDADTRPHYSASPQGLSTWHRRSSRWRSSQSTSTTSAAPTAAAAAVVGGRCRWACSRSTARSAT